MLTPLENAAAEHSGVPVYALYGKGRQDPRLLSEMLTVAEVQAALDQL